MASMKLILLQDVEDLGLAGEEVHVAPGYARNFLLPRKLAAVATTAALRLPMTVTSSAPLRTA